MSENQFIINIENKGVIQMKNIGLFCVHGFLENGVESFEFFQEELKDHNISNYYLTNLQGHSTDEDINTFNYKLCLTQVEEEYKHYKDRFDETYLIGFSMGGVIAAHLASTFGAEKLVMVSPAFKYGQGNQMIKDVVSLFSKAREVGKIPSAKEILNMSREQRMVNLQDFVNEEYTGLGASYEDFIYRLGKVTTNTLINFTRLVATVKKSLKLEGIPTRIYHAEYDELVPVSSSLYIFSLIKSDDKRLNLLAGVHHRILSSKRKDEVIPEIINFLYGKEYFGNEV